MCPPGCGGRPTRWPNSRDEIDVPARQSRRKPCAASTNSRERGDDEDFGRGRESFDRAFTGGASPLVPIDTPPYRAAAFGVSDLGTKGGLRTDVDARVLDADDRPIPGLYAAGNTMAAVSGTTYPGGGNPIGASLLFSHRAAMHMAR